MKGAFFFAVEADLLGGADIETRCLGRVDRHPGGEGDASVLEGGGGARFEVGVLGLVQGEVKARRGVGEVGGGLDIDRRFEGEFAAAFEGDRVGSADW